MSEPETPNPTSIEEVNLRAAGAHDHGSSVQPTGAVGPRLLASVIALAAGVAALIVAIELLRSVLS